MLLYVTVTGFQQPYSYRNAYSVNSENTDDKNIDEFDELSNFAITIATATYVHAQILICKTYLHNSISSTFF